jgi:hypothetical protein
LITDLAQISIVIIGCGRFVIVVTTTAAFSLVVRRRDEFRHLKVFYVLKA